MKYWLMKSEPETYSIHDLQNDGTSDWEGVRNYQARNFMRDQMQVGDLAFFYHSNAKPPGIAGVCKVVETDIADYTSWDPKSKYYDPRSESNNPRWIMVKVEFIEKFPDILSLSELKKHPELKDLLLLQKGSRLSITPVEKKHFTFIKELIERS